ncbi:hypothetical protein ID47_03130 [Candidatus Paracaedibacter acanthamoebae]|uniref:Uncharacterized protein n=1 Tax=Candidatus Odyssella acanthamoebae TaxID=91604 RepID=A0A077AUC2_9PROT|nr:hypothetical protein ID47_03130 [Candidatus Paracaedibacter acanthamoebae]
MIFFINKPNLSKIFMRRLRNQNNSNLVEQRLGNHLKQTNPFLLNLFNGYVKPYLFPCVLTSVISLVIAAALYSNKYCISLNILLNSSTFSTYIAFTFILVMSTLLIATQNSFNYLINLLESFESWNKEKYKLFFTMGLAPLYFTIPIIIGALGY